MELFLFVISKYYCPHAQTKHQNEEASRQEFSSQLLPQYPTSYCTPPALLHLCRRFLFPANNYFNPFFNRRAGGLETEEDRDWELLIACL